MIGNRPSSLPQAQFCGLSAELGNQHGAGRSAAMSTAFHARCAGAEDAKTLWKALTEDEQRTVATWHKPGDAKLPDGSMFRYDDALREHRIAMDHHGNACDPDSDECLTAGTVDYAWTHEHDGERTAYVVDIKRSRFTQDDPLNLQNLAYGFAYAAETEADHLVCGLWWAEDGEFCWADRAIDLMSEAAVTLLDKVLAAASNLSEEAVTGPYCSGCYSRMHCPEWLLPVEVVKGQGASLVALAEGGEITQDQACELRRLYERGKAFIERVEHTLKVYADTEGGIVDSAAGMVWGPGMSKGRPYLSKELLDELYPGAVEKCTIRGKPRKEYRWRKVK